MMGRIIYSDGRTDLDTTAFRYKLTDSAGTLVKDWTTGVVWTQEPAGTFYYDDAAAVPGTRYAVEPATGEVGGVGMVPYTDVATATALAAKASQTSVDAIPTTPLLADDYTAPDNANIAAILEDTATTLPAQIAATDAKVDTVDGILDTTLPLIQRIYRYFFNKTLHTNTAVVIYADDGVTEDAVMAVSGDSASVTKGAAS